MQYEYVKWGVSIIGTERSRVVTSEDKGAELYGTGS